MEWIDYLSYWIRKFPPKEQLHIKNRINDLIAQNNKKTPIIKLVTTTLLPTKGINCRIMRISTDIETKPSMRIIANKLKILTEEF